MAKKFFVTVIAASHRALLKLQEYDMDFFQPTAKVSEQKAFTIEGLITLEEVSRLVEDGYRVLVEEESSKRERARTEIGDFQEWLKRKEG